MQKSWFRRATEGKANENRVKISKAFSGTHGVGLLHQNDGNHARAFFAVYPLAFIFNGTPILVIPMFLCMPVGSLFYYLHDKICDLLSTPIENIALSMDVSAYKIENVILILIIAVLLIPIIVAPLVYRFTKSEEV